jgi:hypothetical protein
MARSAPEAFFLERSLRGESRAAGVGDDGAGVTSLAQRSARGGHDTAGLRVK